MEHFISTYKQFIAHRSLMSKTKIFLRDRTIRALSLSKQISSQRSWIRFPYYHHVFDDECLNFAKQLKYFKNIGDFISIDDAIIMSRGHKINGRFFCITFDDGFKSCITNAIMILNEYHVPAAFFLPTKFIDGCHQQTDVYDSFFGSQKLDVEFLTWDDCRQLVASGMTIGSHTISHRALAAMSVKEIEFELKTSKAKIEEVLGVECKHFSTPFGIPCCHFVDDRDPLIVQSAGYKSFLTGVRGSYCRDINPMFVERDHVLAIWDVYQLRYFFSR